MSEAVFSIIQNGPDTWRIETDMVRSWLFAGTKKALLIDTTNQSGDLESVVRSVTDLPVMLVNTHAHGDHMSCNDRFGEAYMHPDEFELYKEKAKEGYAEAKPLTEGETINIGGRVFEVISIPGHTPGSIALLDRENRILVSGDTVSDRPVFLFLPECDITTFKKSLLKLKELSAFYDEIYVSHGGPAVGVSQIDNELICLDGCLAGRVAPEEPPFPMPAKMYCSHGAGFYLKL